jgi:hypothetical protein
MEDYTMTMTMKEWDEKAQELFKDHDIMELAYQLIRKYGLVEIQANAFENLMIDGVQDTETARIIEKNYYQDWEKYVDFLKGYSRLLDEGFKID